MFYVFIHVDTCKKQQLTFVDAVCQPLFYDSLRLHKLLRGRYYGSHFTNEVHHLPQVTQVARWRNWDPNPEAWIRSPWTYSLLFCQGNDLNYT